MEFLILLVFCWTMPIIQIVMFRLLINWIIKRKKTKIMKYEITKDQIVEIYEYCSNSELKNTIKAGWFPEAFKTVLEAGKWYFVERPEEEFGDKQSALIFYENKNDLYGFDHEGTWINHYGNPKNDKYTFTEVNKSEVFEALKNEAVKRGFVGNQFINIYDLGFLNDDLIIGGNLEWDGTYLNFGSKGTAIFHNGVWGSVVHSITKEEAEKLLNKKII